MRRDEIDDRLPASGRQFGRAGMGESGHAPAAEETAPFEGPLADRIRQAARARRRQAARRTP